MSGRRLLVVAGVVLALLLAWRLFPREDDAVAPIARRARLDLVAACNQAAEAAGASVRFAPQDVAAGVESVEAESGVAALVSVFEARRDGLICRWNGIDPATLMRGQ
ncbi:MAG: hypothetical protein CTY15_03775 [Methylocystis sp.]|nr:MAG: hypothetical protein CTY15_03775 [Methylocystis sp.]